VGFYDPLGFAKSGMGEAGTLAGEEAVIGFLRAAEIKHGRVAMAAFVGFIVQSNGIHFPWDLTTSGISHADIAAAGGPAAQWDALPTASKMQARLASPVGCRGGAEAVQRRCRGGAGRGCRKRAQGEGCRGGSVASSSRRCWLELWANPNPSSRLTEP
jgi:hypothetical protein